VTDATVELLFDLLCKDREHRPADAREVSDRIEAIIHDRVAGEEPSSLAGFLEERFAERRRADQERRAQAVAVAQTRAAHRAKAARRRRVLVAAAGALALGGSAALGAWAAGAFAGERSVEPVEVAATPPPSPARADGERGVEEPDERPVPGADIEASENVAPQKRPRRRIRRRSPAPASTTAPERERDRRLWSWE